MRWSASKKMFAVVALLLATQAVAQMRVQDVARLQGQRTNRLFGFGLVVGLDGSGDGGKSPGTLRALAQLHRLYHQPIVELDELKANNNVAVVSVEVLIPEFGAREGQALDVVVAALGPAKSLAGGQLLTTPLQESMLAVPDILALAGGLVELSDASNPRRGVIRKGATLEEDFFYNFIEEGAVTLVLDDAKSGFPWAQAVARGINQELSAPAAVASSARRNTGRAVVLGDFAAVTGPRTVRVQLPPAERERSAAFISRVLEATIFEAPPLTARVVINRTKKTISFTGAVTIAPTLLQLPLGTVSIGGTAGGAAAGPTVVGLDTVKDGRTEFGELLNTLSKLQLTPDQMVDAVEQLHQTGTLNAQLIYTE